MNKHKPLPKQFHLPKWFYVVIGFIVLGIAYLYLLSNGQIRYAEAYVNCGWQQPILGYKPAFSSIAGGLSDGRYFLPGEYHYLPKGADFFSTYRYFCSEDRAKADGYLHQ